MDNKIDTSYEYDQILHLLEQFNINGQVDTTIIFGALGEEARLDYSTWEISNDEYKKYKTSGFFNLMQHLLDNFIQYRGQHHLFESYNGIIRIKYNYIAIAWVSNTFADDATQSIRDEDNVDR